MKSILYTFLAFVCVANTAFAQIAVTGNLQNTNGMPVTVSLDVDGINNVSATTDAAGYFSTTISANPSDWIHLTYMDCNGNAQHSYAMYVAGFPSVDFLKNYCPAMNPYPMTAMVHLDNTNGAPVTVEIEPNFTGDVYTVTTDADGWGFALIPVFDLLDPIEYRFTDCNGQLQTQIHAQFADTFDLFTADHCPDSVVTNPCDSASLTASYDATTNTFSMWMDSVTQSFGGAFVWHFGDGDTSSQQFPSHVYATSGLYNVCLVLSSGPAQSCSFCHVIGLDSLGNPVLRTDAGFTLNIVPFNASSNIAPLSTFEAEVFPNPVTHQGTLRLHADKATDVQLSIYNALGQPLNSFSVTAQAGRNDVSLPVEKLANGVYTITVASNGKKINRRFIK